MQIIERLKQILTSLLDRLRGNQESRGAATEAAEQLWYEGQHESAPVGDSDAGSTHEPPATPKRRTPPE